ncbi:MAG: NAD(P)-dependent alcohol dehydrogenase [Ignavibacteriae bacterium]|nr:MAG: NAD(P)-dependent alcohol dehydrogenase [Ignavibacteriota bacterium]
MKAIHHTAYGNPTKVLTFADAPTPSPGPTDVLVRVHAAAANAGDWHVIRGTPFMARFAFGLFTPKHKVAGSEFAGVVEAVGANVSRARVGDRVFGDVSLTGMGAFAEYVRAPQEVIARIPEHVTFEQAAALPFAAITALQGLRDVGKIQRGMKVLINGASGGVGSMMVQLAAYFGAEVTAVCSGRNAEYVRGLGAHHVIDYTTTDFANDLGRYDLIMDVAAYRPFTRIIPALTNTGTYVFTGGGTGTMLKVMVFGGLYSKKGGRSVKFFMARANAADFDLIADLARQGAIHTHIERKWPLHQAGEAVAYVEQGRTRGKVVLTVA